MEVYPAVDVKDGRCVRLRKGRMEDVTVYGEDPSAQALEWERRGAAVVHMVDLDGAVGGRPQNAGVVKRTASELGVRLQVGGGVRNLGTVEEYLEAGVWRVILGTAAVQSPELVREAARLYGDRIAVGVDARGGMVAVRGWVETTELRAVEFCLMLQDLGVGTVIFTDIDRDGMLTSPNFEATEELARALGISVAASGGVAALEHIARLKELEPLGVEGVIVGKALYDGRVDLEEALALARGCDPLCRCSPC